VFATVVGPIRTRWPSLDAQMTHLLVGPIGLEVDMAAGGAYYPRCSVAPRDGLNAAVGGSTACTAPRGSLTGCL
jgi:hypothetical protein